MILSPLSTWTLKMLGWSIHAEFPATDKYVMIVAPHTSNWDFPLGLLAAWSLKLKAHWLGKHTLFRWPLGSFFRAIGGLPVDRSRALNRIQQMADSFASAKRPILAMAPEGTRSREDHWKTGFYHIARAAQVPIAMAYLDWGKKQVGFGDAFDPGDDIEEVFTRIREYYRDRRGKSPEKESLIRVRSKY